jgi:menaquinone-9 beta-reductase
MARKYDAVVVGAGPAGSATAYHLARNGRDVLLVERYAFPRDKACGDGVTRTSVELLAEMGVVEQLVGQQVVRGVRVVSERGKHFDRLYRPRDVGRPDYGLVVPRHTLDHLICQRAVVVGAQLREHTSVLGPLWHDGRVRGVRVRRDGLEEEIEAEFVVAADGGSSPFARRVGLKDGDRWSTGYAMRGYVADLPSGLDDLFQVYVPLVDQAGQRTIAGYGWVFPLPEQRANVGVGFFPTQQQDFAVNLRHAFDNFLESVRQRDPLFSAIRLTGRLRGAPLSCGLAASGCSAPGVVLVGDAAGLVDPFSGEGIDTALESGKLAADVLDAALARTDPAGADLREYGRLLEERYGDRFHLGKKLVKTYGFMWNLIETTAATRRPLFTTVRNAIIDYGVSDRVSRGALPSQGLPRLDGLRVTDDLERVRSEVASAARADFPLLAKVTGQLTDRVAQFVRSTLLLLACRVGGRSAPDRVRAATAVELACLALQVHADVLDREVEWSVTAGDARQGIHWGNLFAMSAGDYLLTRSYRLAAELGADVSQLMSRATADVCMGTLQPMSQARQLGPSLERYVEIADRRTATLFALPCRLGARLGGAPDAAFEQLAEYGRQVGLAFQLTSDVLDLLGDPDDPARRPAANLLQDGLLTYPVLVCLRGPAGGQLARLLGAASDEATLRRGLAILRDSGAIEATHTAARGFAEEARRTLDGLPATPVTAALADLAQYVAARASERLLTTAAIEHAVTAASGDGTLTIGPAP